MSQSRVETAPPAETWQPYCPVCETQYPADTIAGGRCPKDGTKLVTLAAATDPLIGRELDERYTIIERLGGGGMGTVYRGSQHSVGREVAIKVVNARHLTDATVIKRFLREAKLASRISHPNAVAILDFGQSADGLFYLVMELVDGRTLEETFLAEGVFSPERVARVGIQICDALEGAHALKVVHRDLKPANVMLMRSSRDFVKVLDFGLAKSLSAESAATTMTFAGEVLGTPAFMPPEYAAAQESDHRADLYSLGCVLYVLATGRLPFSGETIHELLMKHASQPPPQMTGVPETLARVVLRLMAKAPADRYASSADARAALDNTLLDLREWRTPLPVDHSGANDKALPTRGRVGRMPPRSTDQRLLEQGDTVSAAVTAVNAMSMAQPTEGAAMHGGLAPGQPMRKRRWRMALVVVSAISVVVALVLTQARPSAGVTQEPVFAAPHPEVKPPPIDRVGLPVTSGLLDARASDVDAHAGLSLSPPATPDAAPNPASRPISKSERGSGKRNGSKKGRGQREPSDKLPY